jgi:arylsulfatase A-like enzyme
VPKKYHDLFPLESIELPPNKPDDLGDVPPPGVEMARPSGDHKAIVDSGRWKAAIQAYLAAIAYADMNIGRLLDAFEKGPHRDRTIVVLWGDHGWHLGEKLHWRKFTLWEEATRAPLIWVVPGVTKGGTLCHRTVDFMSLYPTLCDLAGVPCPGHVEGRSIKELLRDPAAPWTTPALTTFGFRNHAVRDERWRYIRYADGSEELYDEETDPYEWTNLAGVEAHAAVKARLSQWLPKSDQPAPANRRPTRAANRPR